MTDSRGGRVGGWCAEVDIKAFLAFIQVEVAVEYYNYYKNLEYVNLFSALKSG